jgi:hypothetical protein
MLIAPPLDGAGVTRSCENADEAEQTTAIENARRNKQVFMSLIVCLIYPHIFAGHQFMARKRLGITERYAEKPCRRTCVEIDEQQKTTGREYRRAIALFEQPEKNVNMARN